MATYTADTIGVYNGPRKMMETWWELPRTLCGGTQAMRNARSKYLPLTAAERTDITLYEARLAKTRLWPAFADGCTDLASMPFQFPPTLEGVDQLPPSIQKVVNNADREGTSLWSFMSRELQDAIERGVAFFMADNVPTVDKNGRQMTEEEAEAVDARPYFRRILPDNLVGFLTARRNGREVLTDLRIRDTTVGAAADGADVSIERIQHWTETAIEVWEKNTQQPVTQEGQQATAAGEVTQGTWHIVEQARPHGFPDGIPLLVVYTKKVGTLTGQPPLEDLAWENVAHWQSRSHQDDALAYCRAPIFSGTGVDNKLAETRPKMGAGATVMSKDPQAKFAFVEIAGTSLQAGERQLEKIEQKCAMLAKQPLVQVNGPETATGEVRADVREKAAAQKWTEAVEWAFYDGFRKLIEWHNAGRRPGEPEAVLPDSFDLHLFRDFAILGPGAQQDMTLFQADVREGRMTKREYLLEMVRRGKRREGFDVDAELEELENEETAKTERQMTMLAAQMKAQRPENQPPGEPPGDGGGDGGAGDEPGAGGAGADAA